MKGGFIYVFAFMLIALFSSSILASERNLQPSFNCRSKLNLIEKMICNDKELSSLDKELSSIYESLTKTRAIINSQREWLKNRNKNCTNSKDMKNCITSIYMQRTIVLKRFRPEIVNCRATFKTGSITSYEFDGENKKFEKLSTTNGPFSCILVGYNTDKDGEKRYLCEKEYWYDLKDIKSFNHSKCKLDEY